MSNLQNAAGYYELQLFKIWSRDGSRSQNLTPVVVAFTIEESIKYGSVRGSAAIIEGFNFLNEFPLIGEELLEIVYTDFFGKRNQEFYAIYSVTDTKHASDAAQGMIQYRIHFTSVQKFYSEQFRVQKAYSKSAVGKSKISEFAELAFDEFYKTPIDVIPALGDKRIKQKELVIEPTDGDYRFVIPKYSPEQTMQFFAKRAYIQDDESSNTFKFFEARDAFYFATNEYLYTITADYDSPGVSRPTSSLRGRPVYNYYENYQPNISAAAQTSSAMYGIIDINFMDKVNTIEDIIEGGYKRRIYEIDLLNGNVWDYEYDHSTSFDDEELKLTHTKEFVAEFMDKKPKEVFVFRDYTAVTANEAAAGVRTNQFYTELHTKKAAHLYHMKKNKIEITIYGRNDLFAGSYINLNLVKPKVNPGSSVELDRTRSGLYLVESSMSIFKDAIYTQKLVLTRDGIGR